VDNRRFSLTVILLFVALQVIACGGSKRTTSSRSEGTTEQPAEVAGGFGLTCTSESNKDDASKSDFTCVFANKDGEKFKTRPGIKLQVDVKIGDKIVNVTLLSDDATGNFRFTVAKTDVDLVQIGARFVDPNDPTKVLVDKSSPLSIVLLQGWVQEAYLKAPNRDSEDSFGTATSISGDIIVITASYEDSNQTTITNGSQASSDNSNVQSGAAYVFKRTGTIWTQEAYLKASNTGSQDYFGYSTAVSENTIVVGAYGEDSNQTTITNGPNGSSDDSSSNSGAAYVFRRTGTNWAQEAYLKASNNHADDFFGISVAISGDTIVVGANQEDSSQTTITNGPNVSSDDSSTNSGAAYVFRRTGTTWAQEAYLKATNNNSHDQFSYSVSISGDTIVVGAYDEDSNQNTITNGSDASPDNSNVGSSAAYVFKRSGDNWAQEAYLKAPNNDSLDHFGVAVSISGETIVIGANLEDSNQNTITNGPEASSDNSNGQSGAAYVFKRTGTTWSQEAYLKASNNGSDYYFGNSVAIDGDTIVVGASYEDSNQTTVTNGPNASSDKSSNDSGAVYVFKRTGTTWKQEAYLKAANNNANDEFGYSVSISGATVVVGAPYEDSNQTTITNGREASSDNSSDSSGAAYVFRRY